MIYYIKSEDAYGMTYLLKRFNGLTNEDLSSVNQKLKPDIRNSSASTYRVGEHTVILTGSQGSNALRLTQKDIIALKGKAVDRVVCMYDLDMIRTELKTGILHPDDVIQTAEKNRESLLKNDLSGVEVLYAPIVYCAETIVLNCFDEGEVEDFAEVVHRKSTVTLHQYILGKSLSQETGKEVNIKRTDKLFDGKDIYLVSDECKARRHERALLWLADMIENTGYLLTEGELADFHRWVYDWYSKLRNEVTDDKTFVYRGIRFNLTVQEKYKRLGKQANQG